MYKGKNTKLKKLQNFFIESFGWKFKVLEHKIGLGNKIIIK